MVLFSQHDSCVHAPAEAGSVLDPIEALADPMPTWLAALAEPNLWPRNRPLQRTREGPSPLRCRLSIDVLEMRRLLALGD